MRNWITLVENALQWPTEISGFDLANLVMNNDIHHSPEDFHSGDIFDNIAAYGTYRLREIPTKDLKPDLFTIYDDLVSSYASLTTAAPPIIYEPEHGIVIDGNHRVKAAIARGEEAILAYVGDPATYSPPDDDDDDDDWRPSDDW